MRNGNWDIYAYDLSICDPNTGVADPTLSSPFVCLGEQRHVAIGDDLIAWMDGRNGGFDLYDLYGYCLAEHRELIICNADGYQGDPAIGQHFVVWDDNRIPRTLNCSGPIMMQTPVRSSPMAGSTSTLRVCHSAGDHRPVRHIPSMQRGLGAIRATTLNKAGNSPSARNRNNQMYPDVSGEIVIWNRDGRDRGGILWVRPVVLRSQHGPRGPQRGIPHLRGRPMSSRERHQRELVVWTQYLEGTFSVWACYLDPNTRPPAVGASSRSLNLARSLTSAETPSSGWRTATSTGRSSRHISR